MLYCFSFALRHGKCSVCLCVCVLIVSISFLGLSGFSLVCFRISNKPHFFFRVFWFAPHFLRMVFHSLACFMQCFQLPVPIEEKMKKLRQRRTSETYRSSQPVPFLAVCAVVTLQRTFREKRVARATSLFQQQTIQTQASFSAEQRPWFANRLCLSHQVIGLSGRSASIFSGRQQSPRVDLRCASAPSFPRAGAIQFSSGSGFLAQVHTQRGAALLSSAPQSPDLPSQGSPAFSPKTDLHRGRFAQ